jgi:hypothetical protein
MSLEIDEVDVVPQDEVGMLPEGHVESIAREEDADGERGRIGMYYK